MSILSTNKKIINVGSSEIPGAVHYDKAQDLTTQEKETARNNINADYNGVYPINVNNSTRSISINDENYATKDDLDTKQNKLEAGNNIRILNNTISVTGTLGKIYTGDDPIEVDNNYDKISLNSNFKEQVEDNTEWIETTGSQMNIDIINNKNNIDYLTSITGNFLQQDDLNGYATQSWVENKGYLTTAIPEAPKDNNQYTRKNGQWSVLQQEEQSTYAGNGSVNVNNDTFTISLNTTAENAISDVSNKQNKLTAGAYVKLDGNTISVTGVQQAGSYASKTELNAATSGKLDKEDAFSASYLDLGGSFTATSLAGIKQLDGSTEANLSFNNKNTGGSKSLGYTLNYSGVYKSMNSIYGYPSGYQKFAMTSAREWVPCDDNPYTVLCCQWDKTFDSDQASYGNITPASLDIMNYKWSTDPVNWNFGIGTKLYVQGPSYRSINAISNVMIQPLVIKPLKFDIDVSTNYQKWISISNHTVEDIKVPLNGGPLNFTMITNSTSIKSFNVCSDKLYCCRYKTNGTNATDQIALPAGTYRITVMVQIYDYTNKPTTHYPAQPSI